jgi:hypothetical protein
MSLGLLILSAMALGQVVTGAVSGTAKDSQGGVIPGATVTVISESRGTNYAPVITNERGDFIVPNITADVYTIQVEMPSFKTLKRSGITVPPGSRVEVGALVLEIGGVNEVVTVQADASQVRVTGMEQSFSMPTSTVQDLPIPARNFLALLDLQPGISYSGGLSGISVIGGQGGSNFQMDGVTAMETGSNRLVSNVSVESIGEVKVVTSSYQAEYGRSSGLQINAVTKSGTNQYHGSAYLSMRDAKWAANSVENKNVGDPLDFEENKDWGWTIGGPVKVPFVPYFKDKLFFFYNQEFNPRTQVGNVNTYKFPTELERTGNFSKSISVVSSENFMTWPYIKDPLVNGNCQAGSTAACFQDGGVLGKIPASRLYQPGVNILNWYPKPNMTTDQEVAAAVNYNYRTVSPDISIIGWQPVIRLDFHPMTKLQVSFNFKEYQQPNDVVPGSLPGWNDTKMDNYGIYIFSTTASYTLGPKSFMEFSWGANYHHQEGCSISGGSPNFCTSGIRMNDADSRTKSGMSDIPYIYPDAVVINPDYFAYGILNKVKPSAWDGTRWDRVPAITMGGRSGTVASQGAISFILNTTGKNYSYTATRIQGSHTLKAGFYRFTNFGPRGTGSAFGTLNFSNNTNNILDSQYPFANAALGVFYSYAQNSNWVEGQWTTVNNEWFVQDSWKVRSNLTIDVGLRFTNQLPQYDPLQQSSNFLPDKWVYGDAPKLFAYGCPSGVYPCSTTSRRIQNPVTGAFLDKSMNSLLGTIVSGTGNAYNGMFQAGKGISKYDYEWPWLLMAPRVGFAWDLTGKQSLVLRGGFGLFYDRPDGNSVYSLSQNPPFVESPTMYYGLLQDMSSAGMKATGVSTINAFQYKADVPTSAQWNAGVQFNTPWDTMLDIAYVGRNNYNQLTSRDINTVDYGYAFLEAHRDPTSQSTVLGSWSIANTNTNLARPMQGIGALNIRFSNGWSEYHGLTFQWNRRLKNGIGFGINDTYSLYGRSEVGWRMQHDYSNGTYSLRADQQKAQDMFGNSVDQKHIFKANFNWSVPGTRGGNKLLRQVTNGWQMTGTYVGQPGDSYAVGYSYTSNGTNVNITGTPSNGGRVTVLGDPGSGCSSDPFRQFNTAVFAGPAVGSVGLESSDNYLRGCFQHAINLSLARNFRYERGGRTYTVQLRLDAFNAPNHASITDVSSTQAMASPLDNRTVTNLPYDSNGNILSTRNNLNNPGFGAASGYQDPRYVQVQLKFIF